jgi:hypothetical protein
VTLRAEGGTEITADALREPLLGHLQLSAGIDEERNYSPDLTQAPATPARPFYDYDNGQIGLGWQALPWAEYYDLEWTYVNDYNGLDPTQVRHHSTLDYDFRFNSTRVQVSGTTYLLPLVFERGFVLWRVRGVGKDPSHPEHTVAGPWSAFEGDTGRGVPCSAAISCPSYYPATVTARWDIPFCCNSVVITPRHELDGKPWQHVAAFAEGGKRKDVVSYFDGTLRSRQAVTRLNSDQTALVKETIYDHAGRPAIDVLPAVAGVSLGPPTPGNPSGLISRPRIAYYSNFNLNLTGHPYGFPDFEGDTATPVACGLQAAQMSPSSGAEHYYSSSNPDKRDHQAYVPVAEGFPFSHTVYTPDSTGRRSAQGGPGPQHQIGTGHEQKYYYGHPDQDELDRLFGNDAGLAQH